MARPTHDIVATLGEYTAADGTKKKRYHPCGKAFTNEQGQISLKIDAMPCSPEWSGWLSLYAVQEQARTDPRNSPDRVAARAKSEEVAKAREDEDDEIPF
jgi:hypothetical protein